MSRGRFRFDPSSGEQTRSLDPPAAHDIRSKIREFVSRNGVGVVWTTHDMLEVTDVCDRVLFLSRGRRGRLFQTVPPPEYLPRTKLM